MNFLCSITTLVVIFYVSNVWASATLAVDKKFDLTGDGIVDASDWDKMTDDAKRAYADASLRALGEEPTAPIEGEKSRGQYFLRALNSVYK
ncbi:MAG: hypothetical protein Q9M31_09285 [Mariprofundus sp.]|nr:hypothetical protein [Mariprofundus sp.]